METIKTKECTRCNEEKIIHEFGKNRYAKDGLTAMCKCCVKETKRKTEYQLLCKKTLQSHFR